MSRPADARVRARYGAGAKRGGFRGSKGMEVGRFFITIFGLPARDGKVKHGRSGLRAAICALFGRLRGDLCKTVEKLCKSLHSVKMKITNCAQRFVRLCVLVRELCKYRFLSAFGVWALWCGGAPFGRFPSRLRWRGAHLGGGGEAVGGESAGCCARGLGRRRASAEHYARGRPPLPSPSPPCARRRGIRDHNGATSSPQRRGHSQEQPTGERYIIYTRAQARGRERFAQGGEQRCG